MCGTRKSETFNLHYFKQTKIIKFTYLNCVISHREFKQFYNKNVNLTKENLFKTSTIQPSVCSRNKFYFINNIYPEPNKGEI